ncbi:hypothetical protein BC835DRAFT_1470684 [Cytidiella melzeri]|nr:hypothetical protein BC835DRAFT_1470684 [Cytidiella melzeri]
MSTTPQHDVPMASNRPSRSPTPATGPIRREASYEAVAKAAQPYDKRPKTPRVEPAPSNEGPYPGDTASAPVPAPPHPGVMPDDVHIVQPYPEVVHPPAPSASATIVQTSQANEVPLEVSTPTPIDLRAIQSDDTRLFDAQRGQALIDCRVYSQMPTQTQEAHTEPMGSRLFARYMSVPVPGVEARPMDEEEEEPGLQTFSCVGHQEADNVWEAVIDSLGNLCRTIPYLEEVSAGWYRITPQEQRDYIRNQVCARVQSLADAFEGFYRRHDSTPNLLIASTQAQFAIESSIFLRGAVADTRSGVQQLLSDMQALRAERKLQAQRVRMEVDEGDTPLYAKPTRSSKAREVDTVQPTKAKKTKTSVAPKRASEGDLPRNSIWRDEHMTTDGEDGTSDVEHIITSGAAALSASVPKAKGKAKAPVKPVHPVVAAAARDRERKNPTAKLVGSSSSPSTVPPNDSAQADVNTGGKKRPRANTNPSERPVTPSSAEPIAKKQKLSPDDWFESLSAEGVNDLVLGLQFWGPDAHKKSLSDILAAGQRAGSIGYPIPVLSQPPPPPPPSSDPPANAPAVQGASSKTAKAKGKIVVPTSHPGKANPPATGQDARTSLADRPTSDRQPKGPAPVSHVSRPIDHRAVVEFLVGKLFFYWQQRKHNGEGEFQAKINPVIRLKWDEKRWNKLQITFQERPDADFVCDTEDMWTKGGPEKSEFYILKSPFPRFLNAYTYVSRTELTIKACPGKNYTIQEIFSDIEKRHPWVYSQLVPYNMSPAAVWGTGVKPGTTGPLHIFAYNEDGDNARKITQTRLSIGSEGDAAKPKVRKCRVVFREMVKRVPICSHCHRIGHFRQRCPHTKFEWCQKCTAHHETDEHDSVTVCCIKARAAAGVTSLPCPKEHWLCANCGREGHGPYDRKCPKQEHRANLSWMAGVDEATGVRRDLPVVPCKVGRSAFTKQSANTIKKVRTQAQRAADAAAGEPRVPVADESGDVTMRGSTPGPQAQPEAGPSNRRPASGRYAALAPFQEETEEESDVNSVVFDNRSTNTPPPNLPVRQLTPMHCESQVSPRLPRDFSPDRRSGASGYRSAFEARLSSFDYVREDEFLERCAMQPDLLRNNLNGPPHVMLPHTPRRITRIRRTSQVREGSLDDPIPNSTAWRGDVGYNLAGASQTTTPQKREVTLRAENSDRQMSPGDIVFYNPTSWEGDEGYGKSPLLISQLTPESFQATGGGESSRAPSPVLENVFSPCGHMEPAMSSLQLTPEQGGLFAERVHDQNIEPDNDESWELPGVTIKSPTPSIVDYMTHPETLHTDQTTPQRL